MTLRPLSLRKPVTIAVTALLAASGISVAAVTANDATTDARTWSSIAGMATDADANNEGLDCPADLLVPATAPGVPAGCAHADEAPPGVDITQPVSTQVLENRPGGTQTAINAANAEGVPTAATYGALSGRVPCDGDGTSGHRVQAMYVVTPDRPNRYASMVDDIKEWAAGVNAVFNLSAAKTGGVRNVRFVTAPNGDGTCSPTVLNVTVPLGGLNDFSTSIGRLQGLGYTAKERKYLYWADTENKGVCGIALTYLSSTPGQDNPNNGYAPQYARVDSPCWGTGGAIEAHELSHTLGSVQGDAPHATSRGHCYDESDQMCYFDNGGKAMQQICAPDQEVLFDCRDDDYYSTFPPAGSYLDTHWNTADSKFLIGGGDGTGGGSAGVPTRLGGTLTLNNPAIAGLPTQVAVNLEVPAGRTPVIAWTTPRADCTFADTTAAQTTITCNAATTTTAPVTVTVTDNTGDKIVRTSAVTFTTTARTAAPSVGVDASTAASYVACPTGKGLLNATVRDTTSGVGIKGIKVTWFRTVGVAAPVSVGTATTAANGVASATAAVVLPAGSYTAKTTAAGAFGVVTSPATAVTVAASACTTAVTSSATPTATQAGDTVTVTGTLTRTAAGITSPAVGEKVSLYSTPTGTPKWTVAGSATTKADGSYEIILTPLASATLQARFAARTGFSGSNGPTVPITVTPWTTTLTATPTASTVMAGAPVTITGTLTQTAAGAPAPLPLTAVDITYPLAGGKTATMSVKTTASGTYTAIVKPTGSGTVTLRYAGKPGWAVAAATVPLTVTPWTTALTAASSVGTTMAGNPVTISGILTQSNGTTATPMTATKVSITYSLGGGKTAVASATTNTSGRYSIAIKPTVSGDVVVSYAGAPGWSATTGRTALTVNNWTTALTMSATRATDGITTVTGILRATNTTGNTLPKAGSVIAITYQITSTRTATVNVTTSATGTFTTKVKPGATGQITGRYAGVAGWTVSTATPVTITVP